MLTNEPSAATTPRVVIRLTNGKPELFRVEIRGHAGFMEREITRTAYLKRRDLTAAMDEIGRALGY